MANTSNVDENLFKVPISVGLRRFIYLVSPGESSFNSPKAVPEYINEALPFFFLLIISEAIINWWNGKKALRLNDALSSISAGIVQQLPLFFGRSIELVVFCYIHKNYRIYQMDWNSPVTWWVGMLGVDFAYYWLHRAGHEINLFWAAHQVHHSSQEYNLSTALRQSVFQRYCSWMFYAPLALILPPQVYMVHSQFSLLYQFWIHTELVDNLGPLELILNTPSHHRVHHGRNPYCIDKNYAGTLIIWDRMFGTFQAEKEEVAYGLVHPLETWNPIEIQICHLKWIWKRFNEENTISDKLSTIFKGPGWHKGTPRLGLHEELPEVEYPVKYYDSKLPYWYDIYVFAHFIILNLTYMEMIKVKYIMTSYQISFALLFILYSLTTFGALNDKKIYGCYMEFTRLLVFMIFYFYFDPERNFPSKFQLYYVIKVFSTFSFCLFALISNRQYTTGINYSNEIMQKKESLF